MGRGLYDTSSRSFRRRRRSHGEIYSFIKKMTRMKKLITIALVSLLFFSCTSTQQVTGDNRLTDEEKSQGWQLLFNGKNTKGWHRYGKGVSIDSVWKVKDGCLYLDTLVKKQYNIGGDWDISTDQEYDNFDLKLEWKISKNGNSGIIFYSSEEKNKHTWPWETGMEMQVLDNAGHPDAKY